MKLSAGFLGIFYSFSLYGAAIIAWILFVNLPDLFHKMMTKLSQQIVPMFIKKE
jgi:hypothetical protein